MSIEVNNEFIVEKYTMGEDPFIFSDAIVMLKTEYDKLTINQIQTIKEERYQQWLFTIEEMTNNPLPPLPFPEENL
jgi:hypothetical protein